MNVSDITGMRSTLQRSSSSKHAPSAAPANSRLEVCPPSLRVAPDSSWQRLMFWLMAPAPSDAAPPTRRLPAVRADFSAVLAGVDSDEGDRLRQRIQASHSLRELWHLRSDVYRLVGLAFSQREAESRLAGLNRHFQTRAARSQFGIL